MPRWEIKTNWSQEISSAVLIHQVRRVELENGIINQSLSWVEGPFWRQNLKNNLKNTLNISKVENSSKWEIIPETEEAKTQRTNETLKYLKRRKHWQKMRDEKWQDFYEYVEGHWS
jgi:hypothetical protein